LSIHSFIRVCKQVLVANWKLGRDKTKLCSHRISRLHKTVSKFSVTDSLDLLPILFTSPTRTRQDKTVLSCPYRWCELGLSHNGQVAFVLRAMWFDLKYRNSQSLLQDFCGWSTDPLVTNANMDIQTTGVHRT